MSRRALFSVVSCLVLLLPVFARAGRNANGSAWLGWDETGLVTDLKKVPSSTFPLFVHLKNAPDVQALAIHVRWLPYDSLGTCYSVLPTTAIDSCGWTSMTPPSGAFEGDASYTWSIVFPPGLSRACVEYLVSVASCASAAPPADFVLASVKVKDSDGAVDTLLVRGWATIFGGSLPAVAIKSVNPHEISAHRQAALSIEGQGFEPGAQVDLRNFDVRFVASKVLALGSAALTASVDVPDAPGALLDLLVRLPDGRNAQLPAAITISAALATAQASASLITPTNDSAAFRKFDLNANRVSTVNVVDHFNLGIYPSSLNSNALLVTRSVTDTMALFRSKPYDGLDFNCGCQGYPSYVDYAITPPQYATSIGLLNMAGGVFNGTGEFNDYNVTALRLRWTFANGDTVGQTVRVGKHVRNFRSGSQDCVVPQPYYVVPPDSLAAVLYTGQLPPPWQPGDCYYDAVELPLPAEERSNKVTALRIAAVDHVDYCGGVNFSSVHSLYGISIWPNFRVMNSQGQPVVRKSQATNADHGGYMCAACGGIPVGTRRLMNQTACQVASQAMCYKYAGFDCTPAALNSYLQQHKGYLPTLVAIVRSVSPTGDAISFIAPTKSDTHLNVGDNFLVEHGTYTTPLATYQVTVAYQDTPRVLGQATRFGSPYSSTIPSTNDPGHVYWRMIPTVADSFTLGQLESHNLSEPNLPLCQRT